LKMMEVTVPNLQWFGDEPLILEFPNNWDVIRCKMTCEGSAALSENAIRAALESPLGGCRGTT